MSSHFRLGIAIGTLFLVGLIASSESQGSTTAFTSLNSAPISFFVLAGGNPTPEGPYQQPPLSPPTRGNLIGTTQLPVSALNTPDATCSVRNNTPHTPGAPPVNCSAGGAANGIYRCTVECDGGVQRCSAFHGTTARTAFCSVTGDSNLACSILIPGANPPTGPAVCSAGGGRNFGVILCSAKGTGRFAVCSVDNRGPRPAFENACSASNLNGAGNEVVCSVSHSGASKAACTAFGAGPGKFCSVLSDAAYCSVRQNATTGLFTGKCTSLRVGQASMCSVAPGVNGGKCSVINGAAGDPCGAH